MRRLSAPLSVNSPRLLGQAPEPSPTARSHDDPHMRNAPRRQSHPAMTAQPVGEESWLAYLEETIRNANDLEQRVNAVEVHKRATAAEPGSLRIWLANCNYFWSLWSSSQSPESGWSEEEQAMGRELFSFNTALELWQQAYEAIKYRIDDSHLLWDRWISLEMELLDKTRTPEGIKRITQLYRNRLVTPHLTWDETSQRFSTFLNEYNRSAWEESMKAVTESAQEAKRLIAARDPFETKLAQAQRAGNMEEYSRIMLEYLDWEMLQSKRNNDNPDTGLDLCRGLYARAVTGVFAKDENIWHEYVVYLSSAHGDIGMPVNLLDILQRAVSHCPWSGELWSRYILCGEEAKLAFADVASIKHAATSDDQIYRDGMESLIKMYVAWCGYLKRKAIADNAGEENVDIADVGLTAALEDVQVVGTRLYGKDFQGDPKFRLERIYIQYLTEKKGRVEEARSTWEKLASIQSHADSYDFWVRYYMWEMLIFSSTPAVIRSPTPSTASVTFKTPALATAVLHRAVTRRTIDWPERILEVYRQHCNDYELPDTVRKAADLTHKIGKRVKKRREQEQLEREAAYNAYYAAQQPEQAEVADEEMEDTPSATKRKREDELETEAGQPESSVTKRQKNLETATEGSEAGDGQAKRDRENSTILINGLPISATQTKLRQYLKDYGHINNVTAFVPDEKTQSTTALIEFSSPEEAQSALRRDGKYFGESQLSVKSGVNLTVYVANYPPAADNAYMSNLFKDCGDILSIRWPSLKVNTHRRFCYISFRSREAAAKAVAKEGTLLEDRYHLLAKYSDPGRKKNREGAVAEGREVHVKNIDRSATEDDLKAVFEKFGKVKRVNLPTTFSGKNKGYAFVDFEKKEQAEEAAKEMNNTKFKGQILQVDVSKESKVKATAKSFGTVGGENGSASPAPSSAKDQEGDEAMGNHDIDRNGNGGNAAGKPSSDEIKARSIALMGLPDTVNDARVKALVAPLGEIVKMTLQPGQGGARIEFVDSATAGRVALSLDGKDFEGTKLRTGSVDDLKYSKPANAKGGASGGKNAGTQGAPWPGQFVRRPQGRAGLGARPGPKKVVKTEGGNATNGKDNSGVDGEAQKKKSNADFKAMFLAGKGEVKTEGGAQNGAEK